jgi:threonine/homoserine/homoserine lactone efflux protein
LRFFPHDPRAEFRKGLFHVAAGTFVAVPAALMFVLPLAPHVANRGYAVAIVSLMIASCLICLGMTAFRDAASYAREIALRKRRRQRPGFRRVRTAPAPGRF